jgi:hypothetical protein
VRRLAAALVVPSSPHTENGAPDAVIWEHRRISDLKKRESNKELPIIQQTYDLILWYVPLLNRLPRDHKFLLGDRIAHVYMICSAS